MRSDACGFMHFEISEVQRCHLRSNTSELRARRNNKRIAVSPKDIRRQPGPA